MILLLVGEPQISHVLTEYIDTIGVFAARARTADLLHTRHNAQRHINNNDLVLLLFAGRLRSKVQAKIGDGQNAA